MRPNSEAVVFIARCTDSGSLTSVTTAIALGPPVASGERQPLLIASATVWAPSLLTSAMATRAPCSA